MTKKEKYTLAFFQEFYSWYWKWNNNNLSKLKVLKLLFLAVAKDEKMLKIFNKFEAWPYGPVEVTVYDYIINWKLCDYYIIDNEKMIQKNEVDLDKNIKKEVKEKVKSLKEKNNKIIRHSADKLSKISRKWISWYVSYKYNNKAMPTDIILNDNSFYY